MRRGADALILAAVEAPHLGRFASVDENLRPTRRSERERTRSRDSVLVRALSACACMRCEHATAQLRCAKRTLSARLVRITGTRAPEHEARAVRVREERAASRGCCWPRDPARAGWGSPATRTGCPSSSRFRGWIALSNASGPSAGRPDLAALDAERRGVDRRGHFEVTVSTAASDATFGRRDPASAPGRSRSGRCRPCPRAARC